MRRFLEECHGISVWGRKKNSTPPQSLADARQRALGRDPEVFDDLWVDHASPEFREKLGAEEGSPTANTSPPDDDGWDADEE